jgi:hypothetical protein
MILLGSLNNGYGQITYENKSYGFKVIIQSDWILYGEIKNDTIKNYSIVDWGLPKVYSDLEKTEIENSISITGYKRIDIKNIDELINFEFNRTSNVIKSKVLVDSVLNRAYIVNSEIRGLKYKSKLYFVFRNGTGYVINFTGTPGTFDKNIMKFEDFYNNLIFIDKN